MASNQYYKHQTGTGEVYRRAKQIIVNNPLGQDKSIHYVEEDVANLGNTSFTSTSSGRVSDTMTMDNLFEEFQIYDVQTGDPIANTTSTYAELHTLLHSLYFHLATKRDRGRQPYPSWSWNETEGDWVAPVWPKPADGTDGEGDYTHGWNENTQQWDLIRVFPPPNTNFEYIWNADSNVWDIWREAR